MKIIPQQNMIQIISSIALARTALAVIALAQLYPTRCKDAAFSRSLPIYITCIIKLRILDIS